MLCEVAGVNEGSIPVQLWVWQHLRLELPDEWEMLQFARDPRTGRCGFADRYQIRLELDWRALPAPPHMGRMRSDYLAKLRHDGTMPDAEATAAGDWPGIVGTQAGLLTSRFGRYLANEGLLVELVFLWPDGRDEALEADVLASLGPEPDRAGMQRWRAFGLDLLASAELPLSGCVVQPARANLAFANKARGREEAFVRLGMVSEWLQGSVANWLGGQTPRDVVRPGTWAETLGTHEVAALSGVRRPALLRRARPYHAAAWICPADGRLYCASASGADERPALAGGRLSCCDGLELPACEAGAAAY